MDTKKLLRKFRITRGLGVTAWARLVKVTRQLVHRWERGGCVPLSPTLPRLALVLSVLEMLDLLHSLDVLPNRREIAKVLGGGDDD